MTLLTQHRDDPIPAELLAHVRSFELPTGAIIRWGVSERHGLAGWTVALDSAGHRYVYADGSIDGPPRLRVYTDLGMPGGDDDLQGQPDSEWVRVAAHQERLTRQFLMPLDVAWQLAKTSGAANRHARAGETATIRSTGEPVTVTDAGTDHGERGHYIRVEHADGSQSTEPLWRLHLAD